MTTSKTDQSPVDSPSAGTPCSPFVGWVVTKHCYSGEIRYSDQVWTDEAAAIYRQEFVRSLCGEWEEAKIEQQQFEPIDPTRAMGLKDRKVYVIHRETRDELFRAVTLAKLTDEERRVLGV